MGNEIVKAEPAGQIIKADERGWLSTVELNLRVAKVKEVMASQMRDGVHYGKVPGCPKPSLWQTGAEILGMAFRLAPRFRNQTSWRDASNGPVFEVFSTCELFEIQTAVFVGEASRSCSTDEEKYAWRRAKCPEEFKATPPELRRSTWKPNSDNTYREEHQIRTSPGDMQNTIIGMAEKRAFVAAIRRATAASEVFTEGLEQLPADLLEAFLEEDGDDELGKIVADHLRKRGGAKPTASKASNSSGQPTTQGDPALGAFVIPFGKNKGKTLAEIGERSASWYAENAQQEDVKAAAQAYIDSLNGKAPATPAAPVSGSEDAEPPTDLPPDITDPFADQ